MVAFDFETTGLSPERDEIVEFGAIKFIDGKIVGQFESLIDPLRSIPADASRISGIDDSMVKGKPRLAEILPGFMAFIQDSVLMAHNAGFDLGFLRVGCTRVGHALPQNLVIDTQILARKAWPGQKSYSLQNLVAMLQIPPNKAHRALDDSLMCMKLFLACADRLSFMGDIQLRDVLD